MGTAVVVVIEMRKVGISNKRLARYIPVIGSSADGYNRKFLLGKPCYIKQ